MHPQGTALFPCSLCFHYVLIPVDASQGLYMNAHCAYMGARVWYMIVNWWLIVNEHSFGVGLDWECSVCLWSTQPGFKVFHFNRWTANSNDFKKKICLEMRRKNSPDVYLMSVACVSTVSFGEIKKTRYLTRFNSEIHKKWLCLGGIREGFRAFSASYLLSPNWLIKTVIPRKKKVRGN